MPGTVLRRKIWALGSVCVLGILSNTSLLFVPKRSLNAIAEAIVVRPPLIPWPAGVNEAEVSTHTNLIVLIVIDGGCMDLWWRSDQSVRSGESAALTVYGVWSTTSPAS